MAKRSQQDSGEERVTAKSRPMMNLVARNAVVRVVFNFSEPGEETLRTEVKIHGNQLLEKIDQGDLVISILKKLQILKISLWETMKQNWNCL